MLSKINPTTIEALMMRLADMEEKQSGGENSLMMQVATFGMTYQDDLDAANAELATIVDDVLPDLV